MRCVYKLMHSRQVAEDATDGKLIGFFSSVAEAKAVQAQYVKLEGFMDYPNDFVIEEWVADVDEFNEIPGTFSDSVFSLAHEYYDGVEFDYITWLGVYSTEKKAKEAREKFKEQSEFIEHPEGFSIDEYPVDNDKVMGWYQGFVANGFFDS